MTSIILVCIKNFQNYIIDNIIQLINNQEKNIYVITNKIFENNYEKVKEYIKLLFIEDVNEEYNYNSKTSQCQNFRNGFFVLTSERFFYIYQFMKKYNLINCIHIENDVLLYHNVNEIINSLNQNYIYLPFDCYERNIASIMYIPNHSLLKIILDKYDYQLNDMYNFIKIKNETNMITNFPIFSPLIRQNLNNEEQFVSENYNLFKYIFDAAAIGQYLGGIDPSNIPGDTTGFINETCIIKYNNYNIIFEDKKPYIETFDDKKIPIFNLHVHCKNLKKFMYDTEISNEMSNMFDKLFDVVVCVGPNDDDIVGHSVPFTQKNVIGYRNIYLICSNPNISVPGTITINENIFPFNKEYLINKFGNNSRNGWYLQQLLKIYSGNIIPGILKRYLIIDCDTHFLKPTKFITDDGKHILTTGTQYHSPYFLHMNRLHHSLKKIYPLSGISHHIFFHSDKVNDMIKMIEDNFLNVKPFWQLYLDVIDMNEFMGSGSSEYELYITYMYLYHQNDIVIRQLKWQDVSTFNNANDNDFISIHWYLRK
jgi:hypothetical protein